MPSYPPSVDAIATAIDDGSLPRPLLVEIARRAVAEWRTNGDEDPADRARRRVAELTRRRNRVINASGVLLHTNLGRAPLHSEAAAAALEVASHYTPLEIDLVGGNRGGRGDLVNSLVCALTGAEAALVVNNNAGALLLAVAALAGGRSVVVSRGELIEIGGSFRLPEIVAAVGAHSVEVGTTNRTRLSDYRNAITATTGAILKVHPSNYRVEGFSEEASYRDLAALAAETKVPLVADLGSGLLDERVSWLGGTPGWLEGEPGMRQVLESGADLVLCSGDKLLGGPQAGIVAGRAATVAALARHPLARAVRIGGPPLAALGATLALYAAGRGSEIPFWQMASLPAADLDRRSRDVVAAAGLGTVLPGVSLPGAGSAPGRGIPGSVISLPGGETARRALLAGDPPVLARLEQDRLVIDLRAVEPSDDPIVAEAIAAACR